MLKLAKIQSEIANFYPRREIKNMNNAIKSKEEGSQALFKGEPIVKEKTSGESSAEVPGHLISRNVTSVKNPIQGFSETPIVRYR